MKQSELKSIFEAKLKEMMQTMEGKNDDYAGQDALSNFKESAEFAGITPEQSALALIGTKISRIKNLIGKSSDPNNESILDSFKDLRNYTILYEALLIERQSQHEDDTKFFAIGIGDTES